MKSETFLLVVFVIISLVAGCEYGVSTEDNNQLLTVHSISGTVYIGDTSEVATSARLTIGYKPQENSNVYVDAWDYAADGWGWPRPYFTSGSGGYYAASYYQAACGKSGIVRATYYEGDTVYYGQTTFTWPWDWSGCSHDVRVYEVE